MIRSARSTFPDDMFRAFVNRVIAVLFIAFISLSSIALFPIAFIIWLATVAFDTRLWLLHRFTCFWASLYIRIFPPWTVTLRGREKIDPRKTYVIVSNHQSLVDILVAFSLFVHFKWVSKAEMFRIPLIGWNMVLNRYIRLERGSKHSVARMYRACEAHLREGSSVYLFPEGTRSETGELRPFREGAFVLARRLQIPVLPIVIQGSRNALPKKSLNFHGNTHITLTVLDEISPAAFADTTPAEMARQVRDLIASHLEPATGTSKKSTAQDFSCESLADNPDNSESPRTTIQVSRLNPGA